MIVALQDENRVAERVGFYYSANALGRLVGLLLSGYLFGAFDAPADGLIACLLAASLAVLCAALTTAPVRRLRLQTR